MANAAYMNGGDLLAVKERLEENNDLIHLQQFFTEQGFPYELVGRYDVHLSFSDICGVYEGASRYLDDPRFGIMCGTSWGVDFLGPLGEYGVAGSNLKQCIENLSSALHTYESGSSLILTIQGDLAKVSYFNGAGLPVGRDHYSNGLIGMMINVIRHYTGPDWLPTGIETVCSENKYSSLLEDFYQVPVKCEQPALALIFPAAELHTENPHQISVSDQYTARDLDVLMRPLPPTTMTEVVASTIHIRLRAGLVDIEGAARKLKLSVRSLQRKLAIEGTSYRHILDRERYCRAYGLLTQPVNTITEISKSLGYEYVSDFTRAFTRQHGSPPSAVRKPRQHKSNH
ncbi:MAG: helix-turn-helix domain-containing protein [Arenicellales bacterium]